MASYRNSVTPTAAGTDIVIVDGAGKVVDMAKFEELIGVVLTAGAGQTKTEATVQVVLYDDGEASSRWKTPHPSRKPTHPLKPVGDPH